MSFLGRFVMRLKTGANDEAPASSPASHTFVPYVPYVPYVPLDSKKQKIDLNLLLIRLVVCYDKHLGGGASRLYLVLGSISA